MMSMMIANIPMMLKNTHIQIQMVGNVSLPIHLPILLACALTKSQTVGAAEDWRMKERLTDGEVRM
jgi:hypothetical protein